MKPNMFPPGCFGVDGQWSLLNAADVLLDRAQFPWNEQAVLKEGSRDGGAKDCAKACNAASQGVEHRDDLRGVAEPVR
jgi:hypothetical protein